MKNEDSHRHQARLGARDQPAKNKRMILSQARGMLNPYGITFGRRHVRRAVRQRMINTPPAQDS